MKRVIFSDGDFEITLRELAVSIIILSIMISIGWVITNGIRQSNSDKNVRLESALKITEKDIYNQSINTKIGDIIAYGTMSATNPVINDHINGKYTAIKEIEEHYVKKTRVVTYSCNCTKNGCKTCTKTETYWEWDEVDRNVYNSPTVNFFDNLYSYDLFTNYPENYIDTFKESSHVRFKYYGIPVNFNTSIIVNTSDGTIKPFEGKEINLYVDKMPEETIEIERSNNTFWIVIFWVFWVFVTGLSIYGFMYLENEYLY